MKKVLSIVLLFSISILDAQNKKQVVSHYSNIKEEFYDDGKIKKKVQLKNGKEHGLYFEYYRNQIPSKTGVKINNKKNGLWKEFDKRGKIISAYHFFKGKLIYNLDVEDFDYLRYFIDNKDLEISIPRKWEVIENFKSKKVLLSIRKKCIKQLAFCPSVTITKDSPYSDQKKILHYLQENTNALKLKFQNYKLIKERSYHVGDNLYHEIIYIGSIKGVNLGGVTTWIFNKKKTYIITGLALNEKNNSFLKSEGLLRDLTNEIKVN
ncbi:hypothetical protein BTO06_16300 [Tenacibaculum sp. SZ-18]|uniref:toxin-antitoxin system YwqK family antitoxin n=1 Tax=Tenacibaculum sp. SZ-18 TaxID=754423 RepID=UPI000C2D0432|nr:hypothetical protein [Tenacibaculum sp. SZ-18]AUC16613.1 hypothetical protein BTO06_16300 [Tenacibaculum sp. SZ-18]